MLFRSAVILACFAVAAFVIGIVGWVSGHPGDGTSVVSSIPQTTFTMPAAALPPISTAAQAPIMTVQAAPPIATVTPAAPSRTAATPAATPDDDEFVALAISPRAIGIPTMSGEGGFGMAGTQAKADQIALSECRAASGNDDCLTVNAGIFHGCVAYAVNSATYSWAGGSGADESQARMDATHRLGKIPTFVAAKCSSPPDVTPDAPQGE